jgi:DNA-binding NarL/FixJ family response regulator
MKTITQSSAAAFRRFDARSGEGNLEYRIRTLAACDGLEPKPAKCIPAEHLAKAPGISKLKLRIKVLLASDDPLVLEGIKSCLQNKHPFEIVGEAAGGLEAIAKTQKLKPDVVVMDISAQIMNRLEEIRRLRETCPAVKVLVLTVRANRELIGQIVQTGAHAYVRKNASPVELMSAIESLHRGKVVFPPDVVERFFADYVRSKGRSIKPRPHRISDRERQVLSLIVDGFSSREIAPRLRISMRTVQKHREKLMEKLGVHKATELVKVAITRRLVDY